MNVQYVCDVCLYVYMYVNNIHSSIDKEIEVYVCVYCMYVCMYVCMLHINIVCMYVSSLGQEESARLADIISVVAADYNRMVGSLSGDPTDFTPYIHQADHGKRKPK